MVMVTGETLHAEDPEVITPLDVSVTQGMTRGKLILKSWPIKKLDSPCYRFAPILKYVKCHSLLILAIVSNHWLQLAKAYLLKNVYRRMEVPYIDQS